MPRDLIASSELAKALGVSRSTVSRWVREGRITPTEITAGGQSRFRLDDVRGELRRQRGQTG
ncbi:helix-turn-helix domain-containing protein [Saccharopolyspora phatthalungensis]|uniref:helix-turn-helix domain-containing protein n=1 Tax=Saccharopolyspora phatthalungensis TaxID=664693 RepID=UPI001607F112|nr:helix-turn-helix domain-containing protein [Saccharopolyspora phatthalungensis]